MCFTGKALRRAGESSLARVHGALEPDTTSKCCRECTGRAYVSGSKEADHKGPNLIFKPRGQYLRELAEKA